MSAGDGARSTSAGRAPHEERLLDEALAESFPASDPVAPASPGSLVSVRYDQRRFVHRLTALARSPLVWGIVAAAAASLAIAVATRGRRR